MAFVTFNYTKQSGSQDVTVTMSGNGQSFSFGPSSGSQTVNLVSGGQYSLSVTSNGKFNNPSNSSSIGVDDKANVAPGWVDAGTSNNGWFIFANNAMQVRWQGTIIVTGTVVSFGSPYTVGNTRYVRGSLYQIQCYPSPQGGIAGCDGYYFVTRQFYDPGPDNDYDDFVITASLGSFTGTTYTAPPNPSINSFSASPNPQNSTNGTPQNSTVLTWNTSNSTSASINQGIGSVSTGGTLPVNTNLQSSVGSNSPATRTYTLTAVGLDGITTVSASVTVQVRNDNTPSNSWITSFSNLEPNTEYQFSLGQLAGVDMPTIASTSGTGNFLGDGIGGSFSNPKTFSNGSNVVLKFTSLPFNTDITGETGIYGKPNSKTIPVTIGTQSFTVTVTTRPPRIAEDFNYSDRKNEYPHEDIDLISNTPTEYLITANITADDIEIPVEIKASDPNIEVNINGSGWKSVRSI